MPRETYDDEDIVRILTGTRTIAMVGASTDPSRHSHRVMEYMLSNGYRVIPVNPAAAGQLLHGETVVAGLADIDVPFELVDVFRRQDAIPGVVDELLPLVESRGVRTLWLQLDLYDEESAARARAAGLEVVMDRCLKIEFGRLLTHRN
ncbi:MAG: CoA-binding protein [Gammaproteobacteria bacterium]|nr:CoA-binding protein [Gammaproteobacteria bacterium]